MKWRIQVEDYTGKMPLELVAFFGLLPDEDIVTSRDGIPMWSHDIIVLHLALASHEKRLAGLL